MSEENTNETTDEPEPEPTKSELHERVEQLESTVEKMMPSRRDALKLGAAGIAGAAGLSVTSQSAAASTGSAGQIGDSSNRPDIFADVVDTTTLEAGSVNTDDLDVAGDIQVATNSSELSSLLADGRTILLLDKAYQIDNINAECIIIGTESRNGNSGTTIGEATSGAGVTVSDRAHVKQVRFTNDVEVTADFIADFTDCHFNGNNLNYKNCNESKVFGCHRIVSLTLDSTSDDNVVIGNTKTTITNNGTGNEVANNT